MADARTSDKLIVAIPSKGRIKDESEATFVRAGIAVRKAGFERGYRGTMAGFDIAEVAFLSSSEIAQEIGEGNAHIGITGLDLVHENVPAWEDRVEILHKLGFGPADVVVAVPHSWLDVTTVADLEGVGIAYRRAHGRRPRIATKYMNLTRRFLTQNGVTSFLVVESLGATEGTPAAGTAEAIVDITTTGATLRDNHLRVLEDGVLLKSEAALVRSRIAAWSPAATAAVAEIVARLRAAGLPTIR